MAPPGGPAPAVPQGWQVTWNDQYNQWFYVNLTTRASQWEYPSGPAYASQPAASPQPSYYPPAQPQYGQQRFGPSPTAAQPAVPATKGIMGKLGNFDPKAQTAGALLQHEINEYSSTSHFAHQGGHHNVLGSMASLMSAAGAGALGAKFFGGKRHGSRSPSPPPVHHVYPAMQPGAPIYPASPHVEHVYPAPPHGEHAYPAPPHGEHAYPAPPHGEPAYPAPPHGEHTYPAPAPPPPAYPAQPMPPGDHSSGPGLGGLGQFAAGGAAGAAGALAVSGASNLPYYHQNQGGSPTATGGSTGGMASFPGGHAYSGPRLIIHAAAFADKDVTDRVRALVNPEQVLTIEKMIDEFGDPWPEAERKMFSVLYQYGDRPLEVWAGSTSNGRVDIRNEALANVRMAYINKDPGRIICLIWGSESILSKERVEKLDKEGEMDCSGLGNGGFYPWEARNLICYYRAPHGGVEIGHGREGGTMRLPWNPLAKWS